MTVSCHSYDSVMSRLWRYLQVKCYRFFYMPFMHSESRDIHEIAITLFSEPGLENFLAYEMNNKNIIDQFGRFPERNAILGRINTPDEDIYLNKLFSGKNDEIGRSDRFSVLS